MLQFQQRARLLSSCTSALFSYLCRDFLATQKNIFGVLLKNWFQNQGRVRKIGIWYPERLCSELFYPWKFSRHNCIKPWATLGGTCFAKQIWPGNQMSSLPIELFYDSIKKKKKEIWLACGILLLYIQVRSLYLALSKVLANDTINIHWVEEILT